MVQKKVGTRTLRVIKAVIQFLKHTTRINGRVSYTNEENERRLRDLDTLFTCQTETTFWSGKVQFGRLRRFHKSCAWPDKINQPTCLTGNVDLNAI